MSKNTTNGHLIKNTDDGVPNGNLWGSNKGDYTPNTRRKQGKGRKQNTLKLMAINVRGIKSKIMSLSAALNTNGTHICCISESLLTQNEKIHIEGYKIITKSRRCEGGGVMILIRNDIIPHVEIPDETITDTHLEIIWIKTKAYPPIYIGAYYGKQENCKLAEISEEYKRLSNSIYAAKTPATKKSFLWGTLMLSLR